ncbi:MAG TPA: glycerate kinase [Alphaproteobacteria bacterium]|nr:glycerate kinase [Alphaproteobacteria bacterium]
MNAEFLKALFDKAVEASDPASVMPPFIPSPPPGRLVVVGAGKAAALMARTVEKNYSGPISGLVVTRYGHNVPCEYIEVVEASHPVPDAAGEAAARRILDAVRGLDENDLVLCLISGGGSALLSLPAEGLSISDKRAVNEALLRSGANITEMNCVRKHLSAIKGGRLAAAAWPAPMLTLAISDVPGDDPSVIASGPTVGDPTTLADVEKVIGKYGIELPPSVSGFLASAGGETPKPGDEKLGRSQVILIAKPALALEAAASLARAEGVEAIILGDAIEGEARDVAREHARLAARAAAQSGVSRVFLSGGEVTVTIKAEGRGGPNAEYALAMALELDGNPAVRAIACDTDGVDGSEDNAGAIIGPDTLARAKSLGLDGAAFLDANDSYGFFEALGDLVMTGPTLTNVNDFRAILVNGE